MSELLFTGGTVVTAEGSYRADVLVEDGRISAVGERGSGRFVEHKFTATKGLEVRV